jgi:hypothetical protein
LRIKESGVASGEAAFCRACKFIKFRAGRA